MTGETSTNDWLVDFDTVIRKGKVVLSATVTADEQALLAETLGILEIPTASVKFVLSGDGKFQVGLSGNVSATVVQSCVATLEPVKETIQVAIERTFVKDGYQAENEGDPDLNPFEDDHPDTVHGDAIDLFSVLTEVIALEMSAYPRSDKAPPESTEEAGGGDGATPSDLSGPFAALAPLKDRLR